MEKSYKEQFFEWYKDQQENHGLLYMSLTPNFCRNPDSPKPTEEEVYKELMAMINAPDISDPEVLGKFSPQIN